MTKPSKTPMAGGVFLFLGLIAGAIWGIATREILTGVVGGLLAGTAAAVLLWIIDRRRAG